MLKVGKLAALRLSRISGLNSVVKDSQWRRNRLLILCYHGTSVDDEHLWNPQLFLSPAFLRRRLELIRDHGCNVLPLGTAVRQLYAGDLPPRSVAITFDDGGAGFYARAFPIIQSFAFPVTVYLTSYYAQHQRPIFDTMCSYLLWKGRSKALRWPEVLGSEEALELSEEGRAQAFRKLREYTITLGLTGEEKDGVLAQLAELLGMDYEPLVRRRLLHVMNQREIQELAQKGVDFQLHTHRHRVSDDKALFVREIEDNRKYLMALGNREPTHFCYPGGVHRPEFEGWLREMNVVSAVTCEPGLTSRSSNAMLLPRFVDSGTATEDQFVSWLTGIGAFLPKRRYVETEGQFLEQRIRATRHRHARAERLVS